MKNFEEKERILDEIIERYKEWTPDASQIVEWDVIKADFIDDNNELYEIMQELSGEEFRKALKENIAVLLLNVLLSNTEKKMSVDKFAQKFLEKYFLDAGAYKYLMENMTEFRQLDESLSPKCKKIFKRARKANKIDSGVSAFRSLGLTALLGRKSKKGLQELIENSLWRDMVVLLRLAGIWSND